MPPRKQPMASNRALKAMAQHKALLPSDIGAVMPCNDVDVDNEVPPRMSPTASNRVSYAKTQRSIFKVVLDLKYYTRNISKF